MRRMVITHTEISRNSSVWPSSTVAKPNADRCLKVSNFDQVTSMLTALMLIVATVVFALTLIWMLSADVGQDRRSPLPPVVAGVPVRSEADSEFLLPESTDLVDFTKPSLQDSIVAVTEAMSTVAASEATSTDDAASIQYPSQPESAGQPNSDGDVREAGVVGDADVVPAYQRWQLQFTAVDLPTYALQLDHFGIELAAMGDSDVRYLNQLASTRPIISDRPVTDQKQLFFAWARPSPLEQFDRQMFRSAGAQVEGRKLVKFIPRSLETHLEMVELDYARAHGRDSVTQIAKTVFDSKAVTGGYEFEVTSQRYRNPKK